MHVDIRAPRSRTFLDRPPRERSDVRSEQAASNATIGVDGNARGWTADTLFGFLGRCRSAHPELIDRLVKFFLIGAVSTVVQLALLLALTSAGVGTFPATFVAVQLSVLLNFTLNRYITWRDRFVGLTPRQQRRWFVPLFFVYDLTTPTVWMKIVGITTLERALGLPVVVSWFIFEGIGAVANYLGTDRISFGLTVKLIARVGAGTAVWSWPSLGAAWTAMRPAQWLKNGFVLAALPFAAAAGLGGDVVRLGVIAGAFCAAASSVYLINDLRDREKDQRHPTKRFRPIASGRLAPAAAALLCLALTAGSLALGFTVAPVLAAVLALYLGLAHGYTFAAKHVPYLDVAVVGSLYGLRVAAGFIVIDAGLDTALPWVALAALLATAVETGKRWSEWRQFGPNAATRPVLAAYGAAALPRIYAVTAVAALALYALAMWRIEPLAALSSVLVAAGFVRFWQAINRLEEDVHPQEVFLGDCRLCAIVGGFAVWFGCFVAFVG